MASAYFAGGCFWCVTPAFRAAGAKKVTCGFSGGTEADPTYKEVKSQLTGHRETVRVDYDPVAVPYGRLVDIFLESVDPFDGGGQFIDRGFSYTLAVYFSDDEEKMTAEAKVAALEAASGRKTFISVEPFGTFWPAGEEHQDYDLKNPEAFETELRESGRKGRL